MALPDALSVALKEWDIVCRALESGRQIILLRKGGVSDAGGTFELKHPAFLLFPTYLHQNLNMLKPEAHAGFQPWAEEPAQVHLSVAAVATDIIRLRDRQQMLDLDAEHIWTPPLIDYRFNYKPENPLYLVLLRVYRLANPVTIANTPEYAGCKSWVPLGQEISVSGATLVLDDAAYEQRRQRVKQVE